MIPGRLTCLIFALLVTLPLSARAEIDEVPPLPDRKPAHVEGPVLPGDQPTIPWTSAEIDAAKAECDKLLKDLAIDYEPLPPIKEGICGAPAPILVKSIGSDPKVAIDPPATITCPLAAGLFAWLKDKVQPEAKDKLGTEVVKLHNATSYACRNRYGGANTPLSEHALANALDVSDFVFASGDHITVLDGWPRVVTARLRCAEAEPGGFRGQLDHEGIAGGHADLASGRGARKRHRGHQGQGEPLRSASAAARGEAPGGKARQRGRGFRREQRRQVEEQSLRGTASQSDRFD